MSEFTRNTIVFENTAGENSRTAKLTDALVLELRRNRPPSLRAWRDDKGLDISLETLRAAMYRRSWRHLPPSEALV